MRLDQVKGFNMYFKWCVLCCLGFLFSLNASSAIVYTEPNPPFNFREKGMIQGLGFDLLEASMISLRPKIAQDEIYLGTWKEVYKEALDHPNTFLISTTKIKEREPCFQWVGPIATVRLGVIAKRGTDIPKGHSTIEILRPLKIATVKETSSEKVLFNEIGENHNLNITRVSTPAQGYKMLEYGRIDALIYTDVPFVYYLVSEGQDVTQYKMVHVLLNTDYYIAAGKSVPKEQIQIMQAQLNRLKEPDGKGGSSMYDRIMANYLKGSVLQP